jgi:hypothetical protein
MLVAEDGGDDDQRFERSLGLATDELLSGDGLTFASRVAEAWARQSDVLDERLYRRAALHPAASSARPVNAAVATDAAPPSLAVYERPSADRPPSGCRRS